MSQKMKLMTARVPCFLLFWRCFAPPKQQKKPLSRTRVHLVVLASLLIVLAGLSAPPVQAQSGSCGATYTVQRGDTLLGIAQSCGVSLAALLAANPQIDDPRAIYAGQQISIPGGLAIPVTGGQVARPFYIVKPGDTLASLASRYGTTAQAITRLNPVLQDDSTLYTNQILRMPGWSLSRPAVMVAPTVGPPGSPVHVVAGGFPAGAQIEIGAGRPGTHYILLDQVAADANGMVDTQVNLPLNVPLNERWVFVANRRDRPGVDAVSNYFYLVDRAKTLGEFDYLVQPGDTLSWIARRFGVTVDAILAANPQISDPRRIYAGNLLVIPGVESLPDPRVPSVQVTPQQVRPGWTVAVLATGFPANRPLQIYLGIPGQTAARSYAVQTDTQGAAYTQVQFPPDADVNQTWVVWAHAQNGEGDALAQLQPLAPGDQVPVTGAPVDITGQLGRPAWVDDFDTGDNWLLSRGFYTDARVEDGQYLLTGLTSVDGWRLSWPAIDNAYLEMTVTNGDCDTADRYGLFVQLPADRKAEHTGQMAGFTCGGSFFIRRWDGDGSGVWLVNPTPSPLINRGSGAQNRLGVLVEGAHLALYANGALLTEINDPTYAREGRFGIFVGARQTENFTIAVDKIQYWRVP